MIGSVNLLIFSLNSQLRSTIAEGKFPSFLPGTTKYLAVF